MARNIRWNFGVDSRVLCLLFSAVVEEEFASLTSSLPDGLDNVTGGQAGTDGTNPRQDRKRLSLRWRNKLASQGATGNAADSE